MLGIVGVVLAAIGIVIGSWAYFRSSMMERRQSSLRKVMLDSLGREGRHRDLPIWSELVWWKPQEASAISDMLARRSDWVRDVANSTLAQGTGRDPRLRKKEAIQRMGPKTFFYLDVTQVKDLYAQVFQNVEPTQMETEERDATEKGLTANLKVLSPKYEKTRGTVTRKTFDLEQSPAVMYNKVEEFLFGKGDVVFGVEDFEFDEGSIDEFRSMCTHMKAKFSFEVPGSLQEQFISDRMRGLALEGGKSVSRTSGYVAMQGEFRVVSAAEQPRILMIEHPINAYLAEGDRRVSLAILCDEGSLTPSGSANLIAGTSVKITCVGKVIRWNEDGGCLAISPIAIY